MHFISSDLLQIVNKCPIVCKYSFIETETALNNIMLENSFFFKEKISHSALEFSRTFISYDVISSQW